MTDLLLSLAAIDVLFGLPVFTVWANDQVQKSWMERGRRARRCNPSSFENDKPIAWKQGWDEEDQRIKSL